MPLRRAPVVSPREPSPWDELRRELDRSRRYGHEFALVAIKLNSFSTPGRSDVEGIVASLAMAVRLVDHIWAERTTIYVLLPSVGREAAVGLVARLERETPELVAGADVRIAAFPADGLTSGALLAALELPHDVRRAGSLDAVDGGRALGQLRPRQAPVPSDEPVPDVAVGNA